MTNIFRAFHNLRLKEQKYMWNEKKNWSYWTRHRATTSLAIANVQNIYCRSKRSKKMHKKLTFDNQLLIYQFIIDLFLINNFLFFPGNLILLLLLLFCQRLQYCYREYNTFSIVLFSTNEIADILYIKDKEKIEENEYCLCPAKSTPSSVLQRN